MFTPAVCIITNPFKVSQFPGAPPCKNGASKQKSQRTVSSCNFDPCPIISHISDSSSITLIHLLLRRSFLPCPCRHQVKDCLHLRHAIIVYCENQ